MKPRKHITAGLYPDAMHDLPVENSTYPSTGFGTVTDCNGNKWGITTIETRRAWPWSTVKITAERFTDEGHTS
jgi:hypothetical protein